jgi:Na+-translocating ferredoxin:NAD+ oxidoreductase RnfA subunit
MATQLNFAQQMDAVLKTLGDARPRLLLHACCGPCSSAVLEQLCQYFDITVLYYTTNCCVLAVTILVVDDYGADVAVLGFGAAYIEALVCSIGAGVGFMLAMVMFSGVRKRVEACDPPAPFKGLPITLIAAAITSLSFMGFGGIVENLFNVTL